MLYGPLEIYYLNSYLTLEIQEFLTDTQVIQINVIDKELKAFL